jgi:integrase
VPKSGNDTSLGKPERDRLLLALMAYAGLRRSELLGLEWDDVDLSRRLLRMRKAKGGRQRTIPVHPALAPLFAAYYATRVPVTEQEVFVGVQGKPLNYTQLGQVFRRYVQELLGHKHLDSTQRYTRVNAHELRGAIKRLPWVG